MNRGNSAGIRIGCLVATGVLAPVHGEAFAGAWTQAEGKGIQIANVSRERGDFGESWQSDLWLERGFGGGWGGHLKLENRIEPDGEQRSAYEAGVKRSVAIAPWATMSVQAGYLAGDGLRGLVCDSSGYEIRTAIGTSRKFGDRNAYVNVETAWRSRGEDCDGALSEISAGIDLAPRWRIGAKAWTDESFGGLTTKAEAALFRDFETYSLGLGFRQEISGKFEESGFLVSVWTRI